MKTSPSKPTIYPNGNLLTSSSGVGNQWYLNGTAITGATGQTITPTASGAYTVVVTNLGCSSQASTAVSITIAGLGEELNGLEANVYPHSSNGQFTITLPQGKAHEITVTDLPGKVLKQLPATGKDLQANLRYAAKGLYLLKIISEGNTTMCKLAIE